MHSSPVHPPRVDRGQPPVHSSRHPEGQRRRRSGRSSRWITRGPMLHMGDLIPPGTNVTQRMKPTRDQCYIREIEFHQGPMLHMRINPTGTNVTHGRFDPTRDQCYWEIESLQGPMLWENKSHQGSMLLREWIPPGTNVIEKLNPTRDQCYCEIESHQGPMLWENESHQGPMLHTRDWIPPGFDVMWDWSPLYGDQCYVKLKKHRERSHWSP
jgi:hypothetical protein